MVAHDPSKVLARVRIPLPAPKRVHSSRAEHAAHNRLVAGSNPAGPILTILIHGFCSGQCLIQKPREGFKRLRPTHEFTINIESRCAV